VQVLAAFVSACRGSGALCLDCIHRLEFADVPEDKAFPDDANVSVYAMHHTGCDLVTILKEDNA
jgi:hypothetical protein